MDFDLKLMIFGVQIMLLGGFELLASSGETHGISETVLIIGFLVGIAGLVQKTRGKPS